MAKFHPFCGAKISTKLKLIIALDVILCSIGLQLAILGMVLLHFRLVLPQDLMSNIGRSLGEMSMSTLVIFAVFKIIDMLLDVWLWILIPKKDRSRCQVWFIMKLTLEFCDVVGFSVEIFMGHHTAVYILPMMFGIFFTSFFLWVVYFFMIEVSNNPKNLLEVGGNKFVKFFKNGGGSLKKKSKEDEEEAVLNSVIDD